MSSTTHTYKFTLQLIADILSFNHFIGDLEQKLNSEQIDWEQFVIVASDHLVLTTCYCRLKQKNLLDNIPKDLENYLQDITSINRNRNLALIEETKTIAEIFNSNTIEYTFLKGMSFLMGDYYQDIGERMVGDIDILVNENQIQDAFDLMIQNGYSIIPSGVRAQFFDHKHLDRLAKEDSLCAVELHKYVLNTSEKNLLKSSHIFNSKQYIEDIAIPDKSVMFMHNILNFQINDKGHYYSNISMRSAYDSIVLLNTSPKLLNAVENKYTRSYFNLISVFFKDILSGFEPDVAIVKTFEARLKSPKQNRIRTKRLAIVEYLKLVPSRFILFLKNKDYRVAIYKDRKRILNELKSKFMKS
ncbi:nucleotidyltransferase family protein [uncultured Psychroserpens sp.]|uniref:nucleotidyltransferase family protein n=1 Tax=uncultured Psychroserpens sp. TaxID=255436 RepID=UPI00262F6BB3|nr:nucleotidyltransferase family protein [uncultured Psychroserpens sp.]